jgi:hypothetical protein
VKTFISYRFTGEDPEQLKPLLSAVRDAFKHIGIEAYCTFFDEDFFTSNSYTQAQILHHAFKIIAAADFLFVLQTSDHKSAGMLMEIGYSLATDLPIVAAVKNSVTHDLVSEIATVRLPWTDTPSLVKTVRGFDFSSIQRPYDH